MSHQVLVYVGGQDIVTHPDIGRALCEGLRHGHLQQDADGDHFAHYYDQRVADLIRRHLAPDQQKAA